MLQPVGDTEIFSLKDAARPPSEAELRKKLTPGEPVAAIGSRLVCPVGCIIHDDHFWLLAHAEEACTLEACYVAAFRMKQRGLVMHEKLDKAAVSRGKGKSTK